ncbi:glycosyltransferase family 2 protein [Geodermatophilus sp. SYSU D00697]
MVSKKIQIGENAVPGDAPTGDVNDRVALLQAAVEQSARERESMTVTLTRLERLVESLLRRVTAQGLGQSDLAGAIDALSERLTLYAQEMASTLYCIERAQSGSNPLVTATPERLAYEQMISRIRDLVHRHLPGDATVIVVSKGDDELLKLYGRRAWHFPREESGLYAGYHPPSGQSAVVHLEALRAFGGQYFLLPATSAWWLDQYPELRSHLEDNARKVAEEPEVGTIFALGEQGPAATSRGAQELREVLLTCRDSFGEDDPVVLDWDTGLPLPDLLPDSAVFAPGAGAGRTLPYLDDSVPIVALRSTDPVAVAEAERVAELAVVNVHPEVNGRAASVYDGESQAQVTWLRPRPGADGTASIVIPCFNQLRYTKMCLTALAETLPAEGAEVVVVDDGSTDETHEWLVEHARTRSWLRIVHNETNLGFVHAVNLGADAADADMLVLLNNDCIPLPGWLQALQRTFRDHDDAGAVGGKLLFPDGRLQEAGGVVFRDGTAAKIGYREFDVNAPLFNFVRRVDYCSGALLATPLPLFRKIGGLDPRYSPAYYEDTDYCFNVRQHGREVYYQNECAVIHVEGATTGNTVRRGAKRHQLLNHAKFVERWGSALAERPDRPREPFSAETLHRLVHAEWKSRRS